jgi:phosphopantothenoylcysteine synthetase/decarboxylase
MMLSQTSQWHISMPVAGGIHAINKAIDVLRLERNGDENELRKTKSNLDETGFKEWSPHSHEDAATIFHFSKLQEKLEHTHFPFGDKL